MGYYGLKQAVCHEPHDKHDKVKRKTQEQGLERRTETDGVNNTETCDDDGVDDASVDMGFRDTREVAEAREDTQDNYSRGEFAKAENNRDDLVRDAGFCHLGQVRIEDIILDVVRSLIFCYSDHTERTVLYIFVNGLMTGYTRGTSDRSILCIPILKMFWAQCCVFPLPYHMTNTFSHHKAIR